MVALNAGNYFFRELRSSVRNFGEGLKRHYPKLGQAIVDNSNEIKENTDSTAALKDFTHSLNRLHERANNGSAFYQSRFKNLTSEDVLGWPLKRDSKEGQNREPSIDTASFLELKHPGLRVGDLSDTNLTPVIAEIIHDHHDDWQTELALLIKHSEILADGNSTALRDKYLLENTHESEREIYQNIIDSSISTLKQQFEDNRLYPLDISREAQECCSQFKQQNPKFNTSYTGDLNQSLTRIFTAVLLEKIQTMMDSKADITAFQALCEEI